MKEEPPSTPTKSYRLGIRKKVKDSFRKVYKYFSYKPQNKQELALTISESY